LGVGDEVTPDDVAEPALSARIASRGVFPSASLRSEEPRPGLWWWRIWVNAAQWMAWFNRRLPRRDSL
jgi:hypothetical protein